MKEIVFTIITIDNMKAVVEYASFDENVRNVQIQLMFNSKEHSGKKLRRSEMIIDKEIVAKEVWNKLNPVQKLCLSSTACPLWTDKKYVDGTFYPET